MSEQITVTVVVKQGKEEIRLLHHSGNALLQTIREGGIVLPSLCDGMGKCGRCTVRFFGYAPLPTQADRIVLSPDMLRNGYRLACMARPGRDCIVETAFPEEQKTGILTECFVGRKEEYLEKRTGRSGEADGSGDAEKTVIAVDIGTTTVVMKLAAAASGRILDTCAARNPQRSYGADVIARIKAGNEGMGGELQRLVRTGIEAGIAQFRKYAEENKLCKPEKLIIAGNTVMGHLFMGFATETLGKSPFTPVNIKTAELCWNGLHTVLVPGISAFVGGDIVAGLYACGLCPHPADQAWLFLDLGTNAEMVMGMGERVVCTAAAAGPAFEGSGKDGALGTDRISATAQLLERGIIDETGLLAEPYFSTGIEVAVDRAENETGVPAGRTAGDPMGRASGDEAGGTADTQRTVWLRQEDIRDIQMAKAAVRSGIHFLMESLGVEDYERIAYVYAAGGMGFYLNKQSAVRIGLLPEELGEKLYAAGNTSLAGAVQIGRKLAETELMKELESYADKAEVFNLAEKPQFEKTYIGYMNFPMTGDGSHGKRP